MALQQVVLFPLHVGVLTVLHTVFACMRFWRVVSRHHQSTLEPDHPNPTSDLAEERWTKVPKHLAVVFAPTRSTGTRRGDFEIKATELSRLVRWSRQLGITDLTVYDRDGLLASYADDVARLDLDQPLVVSTSPEPTPIVTLVPAASSTNPPQPASKPDPFVPDACETMSSSDGTGTEESSLTLVSEDVANPSLPKASIAARFTLRLISREAGRPQLASLARRLATSVRESPSSMPLSSERVAQAFDAFPLPEPDLLFVFGGPHLRLHGFPPWQIRLSEMYHFASPAWLPLPKLTYGQLRKALDVYGRAEMRLGR